MCVTGVCVYVRETGMCVCDRCVCDGCVTGGCVTGV